MKSIKSVILSATLIAFSANVFAAHSRQEQPLLSEARSSQQPVVAEDGSDRTPGFQRIAEGGSDRTPGFQRIAEGGSDRLANKIRG
ncbi:hypothetical protein ACYU03_13285 [Pseudomonas sp. X10]